MSQQKKPKRPQRCKNHATYHGQLLFSTDSDPISALSSYLARTRTKETLKSHAPSASCVASVNTAGKLSKRIPHVSNAKKLFLCVTMPSRCCGLTRAVAAKLGPPVSLDRSAAAASQEVQEVLVTAGNCMMYLRCSEHVFDTTYRYTIKVDGEAHDCA